MSGRPNRIKTAAFRQRCTIQTPVETQDSAGQPVVTWSNFLQDEPCQFLPSGGSESMRGRQLEASIVGMFRVRKRPGYTTKMQVVHNGTEYGITYVNAVDGLDRYLELMVRST
jgi:SPP1 family predicted phage head-tail adaptor